MLVASSGWRQQAALLPDGRVLVADGLDAEVYNPATNMFTRAGPYALTEQFAESVTVLGDGRILLLGSGMAQIYDPARNTFSAAGTVPYRALFTATLLSDGRVLIAGGTDETQRFKSADLYDPVTGVLVDGLQMQDIRDAQAAVRLQDGAVLVVGGDTDMCSGVTCSFAGSLAAAELYEPFSAAFAITGSMSTGRTGPTATLLRNGDVLIAGGVLYCGPGCFSGSLSSAEIYQPSR
jgi:hypothetical protein